VFVVGVVPVGVVTMLFLFSGVLSDTFTPSLLSRGSAFLGFLFLASNFNFNARLLDSDGNLLGAWTSCFQVVLEGVFAVVAVEVDVQLLRVAVSGLGVFTSAILFHRQTLDVEGEGGVAWDTSDAFLAISEVSWDDKSSLTTSADAG